MDKTQMTYDEFKKLAKEIETATMNSSNLDDAKKHYNYFLIKKEGKNAIPFCVKFLKEDSKSWFPIVLLRDIVGAAFVVPGAAQGKFDFFYKKWLEWATENGY